MGRIILLAMEEVMGHNGVSAVLNLAKLGHLVDSYPLNNFERQFSFDALGAMQQAQDEMHGRRSGEELALRTGHMCFKFGIKEFGPVLAIADVALRLLPLGMKLRVGLEVFAETFNKFTDQVVQLSEDEARFFWVIERCPVCWGRHTDQPCCHLAIGVLQESLYWVSGGRDFQIEEVTCIAQGDPTCTITMDKQLLD